MNPEDLVAPACWALTALAALALVLLRNPNSRLSRYVDCPADDTTTDRKALR